MLMRAATRLIAIVDVLQNEHYFEYFAAKPTFTEASGLVKDDEQKDEIKTNENINGDSVSNDGILPGCGARNGLEIFAKRQQVKSI